MANGNPPSAFVPDPNQNYTAYDPSSNNTSVTNPPANNPPPAFTPDPNQTYTPYQYYLHTGHLAVGGVPKVTFGKVTPESVTQYWVGRGVPLVAAQGISQAVGGESGFDPMRMGDSGTSGGLYMYHADRLQKLKDYAQSQGKDWRDPQVQHDFGWEQVHGGDPEATAHFKEITEAKTPGEAAQLWSKYFERPATQVAQSGPGSRWVMRDGKLISIDGNGGWDVDENAVTKAESDPNSVVMWTPIKDLLSRLPPIEDTTVNRNQQKSLTQSLAKGEPINELPTVDVSVDKDGNAKITDFDGRHRLQEAADRGLQFVPVQYKGIKPDQTVKTLQPLKAGATPLDFTNLSKVDLPKTQPEIQPGDSLQAHLATIFGPIGQAAKTAAEKTIGQFGSLGAGAAELPVGIAQLLSHGGAELGVPGAEEAVKQSDILANILANYISSHDPILGAAGNVLGSIAVPVTRIPEGLNLLRSLPYVARSIGAVAAAEPITGEGQQNYFSEKAKQAAEALGAGAGLAGVGSAVGKGLNLVGRIVTPTTFTKAATGLFGKSVGRVTPEFIDTAKTRIDKVINDIEDTYKFTLNTDIASGLGNIKKDAINKLGKRAKPIINELFHIEDIAKLKRTQKNFVMPRKNTVSLLEILENSPKPELKTTKSLTIPGDVIGSLWRKGSKLDNLTKNSDSDISRFAQRIQNLVKSSYDKQLPKPVAKEYNNALRKKRDLELVIDATKSSLGVAKIDPQKYVAAASKEFPLGQNPTRSAGRFVAQKPSLNLARAAAETWPSSRIGRILAYRIGRDLLGATLGGYIGSFAGPAGAVPASLAGLYGAERLAETRLASQNALRYLRPGQGAMGGNVLNNTLPMVPGAAALATGPLRQ